MTYPKIGVAFMFALASAVRTVLLAAGLIAGFAFAPPVAFAQSDALRSWNDGAPKKSIMDMKQDWRTIFPAEK
jgi:hypothetical protein